MHLRMEFDSGVGPTRFFLLIKCLNIEGGFRSSGKSRGSKAPLNKKVTPYPHQPNKDDPEVNI